jgi:sugar lactone lactonase YvrE
MAFLARTFPFLFIASTLLGAPVPVVRTVSGDGTAGFGEGGAVRWNYPYAATSDMLGNIYVADTENHVIRVIHPDGEVRIVAGRLGSKGTEDGIGSAARFDSPRGIATGYNGDLFVADSGNHAIRRIDASGRVTTFAGLAGHSGSTNGSLSEARFTLPSGLTVDMSGSMYVTDTGNHTLRRITADGWVSTFSGKAGVSGSDDGFTSARFSFPWGIAMLPSGELLVTDQGNHTVRAISLTGDVRTLYGRAGIRGYVDGEGADVRFSRPSGITTDSAGNAFIADAENNVVRIVTLGRVYTFAGSAQPCFRDGPAYQACFDHPLGVAVIGDRLLVIDTYNQRVRLVETASARRRSVRR